MLDECCTEDRVCLTAQELVDKAKDDLSEYFDPLGIRSLAESLPLHKPAKRLKLPESLVQPALLCFQVDSSCTESCPRVVIMAKEKEVKARKKQEKSGAISKEAT
jgi:hypothetical protein